MLQLHCHRDAGWEVINESVFTFESPGTLLYTTWFLAQLSGIAYVGVFNRATTHLCGQLSSNHSQNEILACWQLSYYDSATAKLHFLSVQ